jgi:hypothetical protein
MKPKPNTITDKLRAAILNDLAELRALREELANTPQPASPLRAFADAMKPPKDEDE